MEEIKLSWDEFQTFVLDKIKTHSRLLFRGLSSSDMSLSTTLDRMQNTGEFSVEEYYKRVVLVIKKIETYVNKVWNLPNPDVVDFSDNELIHSNLKIAEAMTYLRHHGYPSPLMDWTESPYVAAFFAFWDYGVDGDKAIYLYDYSNSSWSGSDPRLVSLGDTIKSDIRHYLQQSHYTLCQKKKGNMFYYARHEEVFLDKLKNNGACVKVVLPKSERTKILSHLNLMNITPFSLFGDEDALVKSLALEDFGEMKAK